MSRAIGEPPPSAAIVPRRGMSWAWLVPAAALIATGILLFQAYKDRGPVVRVTFRMADGLEAGDPVMYRGLRVGEVRSVALAEEAGHVVVRARLRGEASRLAVEGTRFWIVRPEISLTRVSGLDTLLGPRYLRVEPGSGGPSLTFAGLDRPPAREAPGDGSLEIVVEATRRGSIAIGSPVSYRGVAVGAVRSMTLSEDARSVEMTLAIEPGYATLVRDNSRFWNAGGIGIDWGLMSGITFRANSLEAVVGGGIGFATPNRPGERVAGGARFVLADEPRGEWLGWSPSIPLR